MSSLEKLLATLARQEIIDQLQLTDEQLEFISSLNSNAYKTVGDMDNLENENAYLRVVLLSLATGLELFFDAHMLPIVASKDLTHLGMWDADLMGIMFIKRRGHWDLILADPHSAEILSAHDISDADPEVLASSVGELIAEEVEKRNAQKEGRNATHH